MSENLNIVKSKQVWPTFYREVSIYTTKDGEVVGTISFIHHGEVGLIADVYVDPKFRGNGYGRLMMQDVLKLQDRDITLTVGKDNTAAIRLYESLGFDFVPDQLLVNTFLRMTKHF